ncbi:TPA: hypothetical protein N0F65_003738 [Lagenidium giganteum]|uniref:ZSWIM1/3 RNaseH-like domain-containing protein n=1 Tax=Lagenidium giganteum TaxID=4803 RepID=A0AAV2Z3N1_9STRA|nr:TPA: hypothetical protein N0F65_003738 [Lagenidium giganteum]
MAVLKNEMIENRNDACSTSCKLNPASKNVRVVVTDKDETLVRVLKTHFPNARLLLYQFHVIQYLDKQVVTLLDGSASLVYAKDETLHLVVSCCGCAKTTNNTIFFPTSSRTGIAIAATQITGMHQCLVASPYINSPRTCPNRLESCWGKLKHIIERHGRMDDCIKTLLQGPVHRLVGKDWTPGRESDDAEPQQLAGTLSVYAYKLVVPECKIGIGSIDYVARPIGNDLFDRFGHWEECFSHAKPHCDAAAAPFLVATGGHNGYGYVHPVDIVIMHRYHDAQEPLDCVKSYRPPAPFDSIYAVPVDKHVLGLKDTIVDGLAINGLNVLRLARNEWLNTDCIVAVTQLIKREYLRRGFINPILTNYTDPSVRLRLGRSFGGFDSGSTHVYGVLNLNNEDWVAVVFSVEQN